MGILRTPLLKPSLHPWQQRQGRGHLLGKRGLTALLTEAR